MPSRTLPGSYLYFVIFSSLLVHHILFYVPPPFLISYSLTSALHPLQSLYFHSIPHPPSPVYCSSRIQAIDNAECRLYHGMPMPKEVTQEMVLEMKRHLAEDFEHLLDVINESPSGVG